jgi:acyl-CoA dehydrogenase
LEPDNEADPTAISTRAEKTTGGYLLNGHKISFTTVDEDDFAIVFAVTSPEASVREGITCFLVDWDTSGFTVADGNKKGWHPQKPVVLSFKDCLLPQEKVLGEEGKAFHLGGKWLPRRRIARGARCVGAATRLLEASAEYSKTWEKFAQTVSSNLSVQTALADMATEIQAARLMVYNAAWKADEGENISQEAAMVKLFTTQMLQRAADRAVHIHGGPLYAKELPIARLCQDAIVTSSLERTLDLQRAIIITDLLQRIGS